MWNVLRPEVGFWSEPSRRNVFTLPSYLLERKPYSLLEISWERHFIISVSKILAIMSNHNKEKNPVLRCKHLDENSVELGGYFGVSRMDWATKGQEALLRKEKLSLKRQKKLFQSSVARNTWCDKCISKREISVWAREFQGLSHQTTTWRLR